MVWSSHHINPMGWWPSPNIQLLTMTHMAIWLSAFSCACDLFDFLTCFFVICRLVVICIMLFVGLVQLGLFHVNSCQFMSFHVMSCHFMSGKKNNYMTEHDATKETSRKTGNTLWQKQSNTYKNTHCNVSPKIVSCVNPIDSVQPRNKNALPFRSAVSPEALTLAQFNVCMLNQFTVSSANRGTCPRDEPVARIGVDKYRCRICQGTSVANHQSAGHQRILFQKHNRPVLELSHFNNLQHRLNPMALQIKPCYFSTCRFRLSCNHLMKISRFFLRYVPASHVFLCYSKMPWRRSLPGWHSGVCHSLLIGCLESFPAIF